MTPKITIDQEKCDKEGLCIRVCADGIFERKDKKSFPTVVHPERCSLCGQCIAVCPSDAITHTGFEMMNFPLIHPKMNIDPDQLLAFLRSRRSVRNYNTRRQVRKEIIEKLIDAARYTPSGSNSQSLEYIVINDQVIMDKLISLNVELLKQKIDMFQNDDSLSNFDPRVARRIKADLPFYKSLVADYEAGKDTFFYHAPILIIIHADLTATSTPIEDATLAAYQIMLTAQSLKLGTCIIGNLYEFANESQSIRELLCIPPENNILMSLTLGYPAVRFRRLVDRKKPKINWIGTYA